MAAWHKSDWGLSYAITIFTSVGWFKFDRTLDHAQIKSKDLNLDYIQI